MNLSGTTTETTMDYYDNTYDYNKSDTFEPCDDENMDLENFSSVLKPILHSIIFLLGLLGNSLMVAVLLRRRRRLRITEIYLLHLALADLTLIFTLPFEVASSVAGWVFGDFLCMLTGVLTNLNLLCGSFLLASIGFDRYLAIVHAVPSMRNRRPRVVNLMCVSLWVLCFLLSLPNAVFLSVKNLLNESSYDCYYHRFEIHSHNWVVANRILHHVCFFFSLGVMCYCYTTLVITLFHSQKSHAKRSAIRLALLVTLVFCFCWLPHNVTSLMQTLEELQVVEYECGSVVLLNKVSQVAYSLGISHCCLNPFLYAFVGVQFRNELLHLLCRLGCLPLVRGPLPTRYSVSDGTITNSTNVY
ncbi:C-X-C chemokine receptor type 5 [Kryptolebias marmoratus]|uniref:Chemokine (C-X-C motif) receptor 5 n=1 Tax=Kryptolebias marmoratus TaxID=37003 RepID=A0A3Q2ZLV3_KRYMA|nr:C-X-C chemokine receptor type 5 [Kryptolebias marmoratus]